MADKQRRNELLKKIEDFIRTNPLCEIKLPQKDYDLFAGKQFEGIRKNLSMWEKKK